MLAQDLFDAVDVVECTEGRLINILNKVIDPEFDYHLAKFDNLPSWQDYTYDEYDQSIELYCDVGYNGNLAAEKMHEQGFSIVWIHYHLQSERHPVGKDSCKCPPIYHPEMLKRLKEKQSAL